MKFTLAAIVIVALVACSSASPAKKRMAYYQQPAQWYQTPQRMMYVQYVQPAQTHARSTQAVEALVAGDTVATGTYLKDCENGETEVGAAGAALSSNGEDVLAAAGAHGAQSFAEAYPEEVRPQVEIEVAESQVKNGDEAKVPRDYNFDAAAAVPEEPAVELEAEQPEVPVVVADLPAPQPARPVVPAKRYLPAKKKVFVELEQPAEEDEEVDAEADNAAAVAAEEAAAAVEDEEDDDVPAVPVVTKTPVRAPVNARRPVARKPAQPAKAAAKPTAKPAAKPLPAGTFFPIDFGGTNGGAIAIANAFSTGDGGSATSHAIAYGSPEAARARVRPSKYH